MLLRMLFVQILLVDVDAWKERDGVRSAVKVFLKVVEIEVGSEVFHEALGQLSNGQTM